MDASKGMSEDMTSLFLPDISHQNTKRRVNPQPESSSSSRMDNKSDIDVTFPLNSSNNSQSNFANFLNNNDFITWKLPTEMNNQLSGYPSGTTTPGNPNPPINFADNSESHGHNHYSNLVPYEALPHHFHHHASSNSLFPNGNSQTQPFSKPIDGNWLSTSGTEIDRNLFDTKISGQNLNYAELMDQNSMLLHQLQQQIQQQNIHGQTTQLPSDFTPNSSLYVNDIDQSNFQKLDQENPSRTPEKKKRAYKTKSRSKSSLSSLTFDYSSSKLTKLLDLKCKSLNSDYKLTDQKGNDKKLIFKVS